jgi:hypothetical protein
MRSVSVIIPTYNRAHFISEAIQSVISQDVQDCELEILVVDDGSTDNTAEIARSFGGQVQYIYQNNQGAGAARNRGILAASGEWVAFLDSDDRWLPYKLSLQFQALQAFPEYRAVHSNFYTFTDRAVTIEDGLRYWLTCFSDDDSMDWRKIYKGKHDSSVLGPTTKSPFNRFDIYTGNTFSPLLYAPCAACWTLLVAKECLTPEIRFAERYPTWEDYWFFCRLSERHDLLFLNIPTAENRGHAGPRLTDAKRTQILECYLDVVDQIYLPSQSMNRPPTATILEHRRKANTALFKEYLKEGHVSRARSMIQSGSSYDEFEDDFGFLLYRTASRMPFNLTHRMVKFKRGILSRCRQEHLLPFCSIANSCMDYCLLPS